MLLRHLPNLAVARRIQKLVAIPSQTHHNRLSRPAKWVGHNRHQNQTRLLEQSSLICGVRVFQRNKWAVNLDSLNVCKYLPNQIHIAFHSEMRMRANDPKLSHADRRVAPQTR